MAITRLVLLLDLFKEKIKLSLSLAKKNYYREYVVMKINRIRSSNISYDIYRWYKG